MNIEITQWLSSRVAQLLSMPKQYFERIHCLACAITPAITNTMKHFFRHFSFNQQQSFDKLLKHLHVQKHTQTQHVQTTQHATTGTVNVGNLLWRVVLFLFPHQSWNRLCKLCTFIHNSHNWSSVLKRPRCNEYKVFSLKTLTCWWPPSQSKLVFFLTQQNFSKSQYIQQVKQHIKHTNSCHTATHNTDLTSQGWVSDTAQRDQSETAKGRGTSRVFFSWLSFLPDTALSKTLPYHHVSCRQQLREIIHRNDIKPKALPYAMFSWWSGRKLWKALRDTCFTVFLQVFFVTWVW